MKKIFLDTNIFLHFKFFTEIDWLEVSQDDKCKIIIAPIVIDELDKHKIGTDEKSKRARKALQKIEYFSEIKIPIIKSNIEIEIINIKPNRETFASYNLNPAEPDNQLIASIIEYQAINKDNHIFICSNDVGPRLRSKHFGIGIINLPDSYLLPNKESDIEKQIKSLIQENTLLKANIPKPKLLFENNKEFVKYKIKEFGIKKEEFVNTRLENIKKELPYLELTDNLDTNSPFAQLSSLSLISQEEIDRYNSELNEYFSHYQAYLSSLFEYELRQSLLVRIDMFLTNIGNVPCEDVDIYCHFPDGFELFEEDGLENPPRKPNPPHTPRTFIENLTRGLNFSIPKIPNFDTSTLPKLNRPSIKKTKSYEVHFHRENIKHLTISPLDSLFAIYKSYADIRNYSIEYIIIAGNIRGPINGKLNVTFDKINAS